MEREEFQTELTKLLNRHSEENGSNTPDFILARYLTDCLEVWNSTVRQREDWYGHRHEPGTSN
jgi:hypothetical protein